MVRAENGGGQLGAWLRTGVGGCELCLRVGSALVLVPLAIGSAYLGGPPFLAVWGLAAAVILWEWTALVGEPRRTPIVAAGAAAFLSAAVLFGLSFPGAGLAVLALGAIAIAGLAGSGRPAWIVAGGVYAGAVLAAPAVLRGDAELGFVALMLLFGVVWTTDVMAYFVGRALPIGAGWDRPSCYARAGVRRTVVGGPGGRSAGIGAQAPFRRQKRQRAHSGSRWPHGSARWLRRRGGGCNLARAGARRLRCPRARIADLVSR